jgi:hypothetical protein
MVDKTIMWICAGKIKVKGIITGISGEPPSRRTKLNETIFGTLSAGPPDSEGFS